MKIQINLPDPKYCNRCPCLSGSFCTITKQRSETKEDKRGYVKFKDGEPLRIRPKICVERNGE